MHDHRISYVGLNSGSTVRLCWIYYAVTFSAFTIHMLFSTPFSTITYRSLTPEWFPDRYPEVSFRTLWVEPILTRSTCIRLVLTWRHVNLTFKEHIRYQIVGEVPGHNPLKQWCAQFPEKDSCRRDKFDSAPAEANLTLSGKSSRS